MNGVTPTRAAVLELQEEHRAMHEGYEFLDEKRLLLASEMLRELRAYEEAWRRFLERLAQATAALHAAVARHGLNGLQVYPPALLERFELDVRQHPLLGVRLQEVNVRAELAPPPPALNPSPDAERCRGVFLDLVRRAAALAALTGNLERLRHEYRRTERRARALEDVLMPEIRQTLYDLESLLEEIELEESVRARWAQRVVA